ncbi:VanZ family protein [Halobacillus litoralis]|uniref:VanZ family protein n=1 Tax=Halobacillus litoralis TaxID=45668 RepID=UPI001CFEB331|nr:VanZ family protein [Halobacillus litoralis]
MYKRLIFGLLPVGVMGLLFYFSSQPYEEQNLRPTMNLYLPLELLRPIVEPISFSYHGEPVSVATHGVDGLIEFFIRKGAHLTIYCLLMVTMFLALDVNTGWKRSIKLMTGFAVTVLYACFDEFHQSLTPNRTPYIGDVGLDSVGALVGIIILLLFHRRFR